PCLCRNRLHHRPRWPDCRLIPLLRPPRHLSCQLLKTSRRDVSETPAPNPALQPTGRAAARCVGRSPSAGPAAELGRSASPGLVVRRSLEETWWYLESRGEETARRHDGQVDRRVCK